ncbi:unnamed protein product [Pleuronectes platessa]|uniref:Uncharacterized protein n=1 Tax=Pleuronectes platessa TaxID=8262 RepID=A0A9N7Z5G8_PLEPL|nr:unnamed protein product [Pleuronectes platessa]
MFLTRSVASSLGHFAVLAGDLRCWRGRAGWGGGDRRDSVMSLSRRALNTAPPSIHPPHPSLRSPSSCVLNAIAITASSFLFFALSSPALPSSFLPSFKAPLGSLFRNYNCSGFRQFDQMQGSAYPGVALKSRTEPTDTFLSLVITRQAPVQTPSFQIIIFISASKPRTLDGVEDADFYGLEKNLNQRACFTVQNQTDACTYDHMHTQTQCSGFVMSPASGQQESCISGPTFRGEAKKRLYLLPPPTCEQLSFSPRAATLRDLSISPTDCARKPLQPTPTGSQSGLCMTRGKFPPWSFLISKVPARGGSSRRRVASPLFRGPVWAGAGLTQVLKFFRSDKVPC